MRAAVIGVAISALSGFLVWSYLKRFEDEASGGQKVAVVTVLHTMEPGAVLKEADLGERLIPQAYVESRMIRAADKSKIANLKVWTPLDAQQVVNWTDVVATNEDGRVSRLVSDGMRAVTVHTEQNSNSIVRAGDRVDVIATLPQPGSNEHRVGVVLLQNILVLGRSASQPGVQAGSNEGQDIALSLTLQNAQMIAVAGDKSKITVALRAPEDTRSMGKIDELRDQDLIKQPDAPKLGAPKPNIRDLGAR